MAPEAHEVAATEWEDEIRAFEAADAVSFPAPGATVFTGSSSIRLWSTLAEDMAPLVVVRRGFGGAQLEDVLRLAPRIVLPYRPRAVVLCAGENDLEPHRGKTAASVHADLERLAALLEPRVARLYVLTVKPSPARLVSWPEARRLNDEIRRFCTESPRRCCVDVAEASFDARGRVRTELFLEDGLHLSEAGYRLWTQLLRPRLLEDAVADGALPRQKHDHGRGMERE